MKYLDAEHELWGHGNQSGSIENPFYINWVADGKPVDDFIAPPDLTDAEVDAQMDTATGQPEMLSILEAIADRLPGPVSINTLRAEARTKGRTNIPRNK